VNRPPLECVGSADVKVRVPGRASLPAVGIRHSERLLDHEVAQVLIIVDVLRRLDAAALIGADQPNARSAGCAERGTTDQLEVDPRTPAFRLRRRRGLSPGSATARWRSKHGPATWASTAPGVWSGVRSAASFDRGKAARTLRTAARAPRPERAGRELGRARTDRTRLDRPGASAVPRVAAASVGTARPTPNQPVEGLGPPSQGSQYIRNVHPLNVLCRLPQRAAAYPELDPRLCARDARRF
jgi:hypothetical protein